MQLRLVYSVSVLILSIFVLIFLPGDLTASEAGHAETTHGEEPHRNHTIGLFLGITHDHHEKLETVGIEYSYRINKHWSLGGVIERAEREDDSRRCFTRAPWNCSVNSGKAVVDIHGTSLVSR